MAGVAVFVRTKRHGVSLAGRPERSKSPPRIWRSSGVTKRCQLRAAVALVRELLAAIYEADRKHGRAEDRKEALRKLLEAGAK
jgi:hypothetical protein